MGRKRQESAAERINTYEGADQDYGDLGPLWGDMAFPDDFEALRALYGNRGGKTTEDTRSDRDERTPRR
ncbi:MAG: hypothetical protein WCS37_02555 [Chloroflexota bacterium]|nr:hypothetical protein [Chloroflexota bacterium]